MSKLVSNNNYALSTVAGESVLVPVSSSVHTLSNLFVLNEVAAFIFPRVEAGNDVDSIVADVLNEYNVDDATARRDVSAFIDSLVQKGFFHYA